MRIFVILLLHFISIGPTLVHASSKQSNDLNPPKNDLIIIYSHGKIVKVQGTKIEKTIATFGDETLQIAGSNNIVYAKGGLRNVVINGMNNEVYVDKINSVTIDGGNNVVQYKLSSTKSGKPAIHTKGGNNDILKTN
ncbi:DUF3060 domain-containing protein [Sphingobacterium griseoflavum]|uniref:DUF3060 domain-containing protein n=1 Tax=Sphingobacterium griseoflavum TaxID=1474952 RepID=A0ABQ3HPM1_9SPHI|nr:DUF3060 domain-containing protein [Sphingobacterium griseoflavum]GHE23181.1 hypothetical protein GCM10017764_01490 [Sphingobacterium griseoflavum]